MNNVALGIALAIIAILITITFIVDAVAYQELLARIKELETNMKFIRSAPYYDPTKRKIKRSDLGTYEKVRRAKTNSFADRSMAERESDLNGTPVWWLQFRENEDFKQKNPVLYTILEAFAKDEQRRYQEENEVFK